MLSKISLLLFGIFAFSNALDPVVDVSGGKIRGALLKQRVEPYLDYFAFKGVPYAAAPLCSLRFEPPQRAVSWDGIREAKEFSSPCPQVGGDGAIIGNEDCLFLNVYTRELPSNSTALKPVMVWIHGGAFVFGFGDEYGPDFLIQHDVVLVTINYRLGILGFLDLENGANVGLKDQLASLKWVQDNIRAFSGDLNKVTIFGLSAGAHAAEILLLSPLSKGLFHQVIGHSGSAISKRGIQRDQGKYILNLAKHFGIENAENIVERFRSIDYKVLVNAAQNYNITGFTQYLDTEAFGPVVEEDHPEAVLTSPPYELLRDGKFLKIPYIFGFTTGEASFGFNLINKYMKLEDWDNDPKLFVSQSFNVGVGSYELGLRIKNYFLGNSSVSDYGKFSRFLTHELYARSILKSIEFKRRWSPGYLYRFSYKGTFTSSYPGVGHSEDEQYIFYLDNINQSALNEKDILMRKRMTKLWTNFAKTGSPTPEPDPLLGNIVWPMVNEEVVGFVDLGKDLVPGYWPNETEYRFWDSIFTDFGNAPFVTF